MTRPASIRLSTAVPAQAPKLHALISTNMEEGHLLPRSLEELAVHADRFVVALRGRTIVGCAELAPLSPHVAEVRSLVVDTSARGGRPRRTTRSSSCVARARRSGFDKLCAFTHAPAYFTRLGFSIVPHLWLREKIHTDCATCPRFRVCGQFAMVISLESVSEASRRRTRLLGPPRMTPSTAEHARNALRWRDDAQGVSGRCGQCRSSRRKGSI